MKLKLIATKLVMEITIYGADARSFIYALNYLSETYLGVLPFWFWNDQKMEVKSYVDIFDLTWLELCTGKIVPPNPADYKAGGKYDYTRY